MGTPGLLSIVSDSVVKYKVFVTCNGMMVSDLALKLAGKDFADMTCRGLYNLAMEASFGCESCLVVVGGNGDIATESDLSIHIEAAEYIKGFSKPTYNPHLKMDVMTHSHILDMDAVGVGFIPGNTAGMK